MTLEELLQFTQLINFLIFMFFKVEQKIKTCFNWIVLGAMLPIKSASKGNKNNFLSYEFFKKFWLNFF